MTKRIYIRGNVGDLRNVQIYDADTDKQLDDVTKFRLEADAAGVVQAWLVRHNNPDVMVDVVPGPRAAHAGQVFHLVTLDADQRAAHCDTVYRAKVQSLTMNDDGTLNFAGGQSTSMHDSVGDATVATAINPRDELRESADRALTAALRQAIVSTLIHQRLGSATGGVVSMAASRVPVNTGKVPAFVNPAPKKATSCPECFDTGVTNGWFHPCSKGCKP